MQIMFKCRKCKNLHKKFKFKNVAPFLVIFCYANQTAIHLQFIEKFIQTHQRHPFFCIDLVCYIVANSKENLNN